MPVVGLLRNTPTASFEHIVAALSRGLGEAGFVDGRNVVIEQRWAEGRDDRLPALLADLISRKAAVIVANTQGALAAKAAGTTIPVVFATGSDPVRDGLVASFNRPGANFTGVTFISSDLGTKRLELLRQLVPRTTTIAMLVGPDVPETVAERADVQNIDLMNLAGFCRNCLSRWYREAAESRGIALADPDAREIVYGMPYKEWQARHQREANAEQKAAFAKASPGH